MNCITNEREIMKNKKLEKELNKIHARAYVMLKNLEKVKTDINSVSYNKCESAIYDLIKELINI
jgi:hypothetical protein